MFFGEVLFGGGVMDAILPPFPLAGAEFWQSPSIGRACYFFAGGAAMTTSQRSIDEGLDITPALLLSA